MNSTHPLVNTIFLFLAIVTSMLQAQTETPARLFSLPQVLELALNQSPAAKQAANEKENRYWQYRTYIANYRPQLSLDGTIPDLNRSYSSVIQPDGTAGVRLQQLATSSLNLSLSQNIPFTGGTLFVSSQLQRIDILGTASNAISYLGNPVVAGIRQPLNLFNPFRWERNIEPLKFEESKRKYSEDMENVAIQATELFFNLLVAQISLDIQQKNLANNDTIFKISQGRYNLGKIGENDLLQMELSVMNARNNLAQAQLDEDLATLRLRTFLKMGPGERFKLVSPGLIPRFEVDEIIALTQAKKNRQIVVAFERQRQEAERDVAKAIGDNRFQANLVASYGFTQSAAIVPDIYVNPLSQQRLQVGVQIPILDWGRARSQIKTAVANRDLVNITIEQAEQNFEQEVYLLCKQLKMYREKLVIGARADSIAQKRYDVTVKRYLIGKITISDLNIALNEKDQSRLSYIQSLRTFWDVYFQLRRKTLYDFEKNTRIDYK